MTTGYNPALIGKQVYDEPYDVEKQGQSGRKGSAEAYIQHNGKLMQEDGTVPGETFEIGNSFYAKTQRLAGKLKIEQRGIERVPEDEREDDGFKALLNAGTMVGNYSREKTRQPTNLSRSGSLQIWSSRLSPLAR